MITLKAIKNHPFSGRAKKKGETYKAKPADAKLMVALGLAKYEEASSDVYAAEHPAPAGTVIEPVEVADVPSEEPIAEVKRGRGRPKGSYSTRVLKAEE